MAEESFHAALPRSPILLLDGGICCGRGLGNLTVCAYNLIRHRRLLNLTVPSFPDKREIGAEGKGKMTDQCSLKPPDYSGVEIVLLLPPKALSGYSEAVTLAKAEAEKRFDDYMLVSWYDRDRDFESPPNTSERGENLPKDGYIHYGLSHGAKLKVDIEAGRFVFFFTSVQW